MAHAVDGVTDDGGRLGREPRRARMLGEDRIDRLEDRRDGAERQIERDAPPGLARRLGERGKAPAHLGEHARGGALEAVDRLLLVADGEERARLLALAQRR